MNFRKFCEFYEFHDFFPYFSNVFRCRKLIENDEEAGKDLDKASKANKTSVASSNDDDLKAKKIAKKGGAKMTLQEFNRLSIEKESKPSVIESDTFFEDVEEATKMALNREQIKESLQQRYQVRKSTFILTNFFHSFSILGASGPIADLTIQINFGGKRYTNC